MAVWALGINHTTAQLDLRGRFAFAMDQVPPTLQALRQSLAARLLATQWFARHVVIDRWFLHAQQPALVAA